MSENMNATRIFVIWNPAAGQQAENEVPHMMEKFFNADRWSYHIHKTEEDESLVKTVRQAIDAGYDWVFAAGGDGTLSAVADGLANTAVPLGVIPVGTANALAQALDLPMETEAAGALLSGETAVRAIDAIQIDDSYYLIQLGMGLDSRVMENTSRDLKNRLGPLAYVWSILKQAVGWQPHRFDLTIDGQKHHLHASELMVTNGASVGVLSLEWHDAIRPDDGQLDMIVIKARSLWDYLNILASMIRGQQQRAAQMRHFPVKQSFTIASEKKLPVQGDGDIIGETPVQAKVAAQAVHVLVNQVEN